MGEDQAGRKRLKTGQALHFHASKGTIIALRQGEVCILPSPLWIGEQLVQESFVVHEEGMHRLQQSGMVKILAKSDAEIVCIQAEGRLTRLVSGLYSLLRARMDRSRIRDFLSARTGFR